MSLVRFHNVTKQFDSKRILHDVFFRLESDDRVGLVGKNGTGKTTVLRLILGQDTPTAGAIDIQAGLKLGFFSQFSDLTEDQSIADLLHGLFADIHIMEKELNAVSEVAADTCDEKEREHALNRQGEILHELELREGWTYQNRIDTVLSKLGFSELHRNKSIAQLSGGWRNRAALAKILIENPDVLLLDEPTNYLDVAGLAWLEEWLSKRKGALIVVSHDRHLLECVANRIVEIENYQLQTYDGSFTEYVREKRLRLKTLRNQFEHEEELLIFEAEAIADRKAAQKSPDRRLKRKLADIGKRVEPRQVDRIITSVYDGLKPREVLCRVQDLRKSYPDQLLFRDVTFDLERGQRIVIVGPNGCGKSTLVRVLTGEEPPDNGTVKWSGISSSADCCYFNRVFAEMDLGETVTHAVNIVPLAYARQRRLVNRFLGLMQFSEFDLGRRIGTLSGGQKARVALALCLLSGASSIVLDEPTNHLDITSTQVMERALVGFPGGIIVVSHDRFFIDTVATHLLVFDKGSTLSLVEGNWTSWQAGLSQ